MYQNEKYPNGLNGLGETFNEQDEADVELAFQVHRAEPGDLSLLRSLLERYAAEVKRLALAWLSVSGYPLSLETAAETVIVRTFSYAIRHTDRFRGKNSLRNWLLNITIHQAAKYQRGMSNQGINGRLYDASQGSTAFNLERFANLPEKMRLAVILRYVSGLSVEEIKETLGARFNQAHDWLVSGRSKLMDDPVTCHRAEELDAYVDGLLVEDFDKRDELESHLPTCEECDTYLVRLRELDRQLRNDQQEVWPLTSLSDMELERLMGAVCDSLPVERKWKLPHVPVRQTAWMLGLLALFAVTAFYLIAQQPDEPEFSPRPTVTPTTMPMVEVVQLTRAPDDREYSPSSISNVFFTADISADGDSLALMAVEYGTSTAMGFLHRIVYLYDKKNQTLLEISSSQESIEGAWFYSIPSISADGRYVTYSQAGSSASDMPRDCTIPGVTGCADIFVYDRQSGTSEQITHGWDGSPPNGISFSPSISADGRWVAFLSLAGNLTEDDVEECLADDGPHCLDIFLYDRQEGALTRVPLGGRFSTEDLGPDHISISADGSLLGFTISAASDLAAELGVESGFQAILYDRESKTFELLNRAPDGTAGQGDSFSPVLSEDGRIVAFTSLASNLVEGDTNESADVFVLDRQTGTLERVSVDSSGNQVDGDSGIFINRQGFYSLNISGDGRYVTYLSQASNFSTSQACDTDQDEYCNALVLHDRQNAATELIRPVQAGKMFSFPGITRDGRFLTYMEFMSDCFATQGNSCAPIMLIDRQRGWVSPISQLVYPSRLPVWQPNESIDTPQEQVNILATTQDGRYLAAAYGNGHIELWDFTSQRWVRTFDVKVENAITSLAFDPNGEWLAAGTQGGLVKIWEVDGRTLYELNDHPGRVHTLQFTPDGTELLVGTPNEIWFWRRGDEKIIQTNKLSYPEKINSFALSPSGNLLAAASSDMTVWLQLLPAGSLLTRLGGQSNMVSYVAFSPDGSLLVSNSLSGEINLWKIDWKGFGSLGTEFFSTVYGIDWYGPLVFSPDGRSLACGSYYGGIKLWSIEDGSLANLFKNDPSQGIIRSVAFSSDGSTILGGSFGEVEVWRTYQAVAEPKYFKREDILSTNNAPSSDGLISGENWLSMLQPVDDSNRHIDLYLADELLPFDLLVPTSLPEQVHFQDAQLLQEDEVALHYLVSDATEIRADVYIVEHPLSPGEPLPSVGQDAAIEEMSLNGIYAEYVQGDWQWKKVETSDGTSVELWGWDSYLPVRRIHFHYDNISVSIYYQERSPGEGTEGAAVLDLPGIVGEWQAIAAELSLGRLELYQIAQGMDQLPAYLPSSTVYTYYQVQEGDTCSGIAAFFDTSVEAIASLNKLDAGCEIIRSGDILTIPRDTQRLDLDRADLDCDGQNERVQALPASGTRAQGQMVAVYLQDMSDMGLFKDVWQVAAADVGADSLSYPQLISLGTCETFVAFQVIKDNQPELRVYRWMDGQMYAVLELGREISAVNVDNGTLTVRQQVTDTASGVCQVWGVVYSWDDQQFVEIDRFIEPNGGPCQ